MRRGRDQKPGSCGPTPSNEDAYGDVAAERFVRTSSEAPVSDNSACRRFNIANEGLIQEAHLGCARECLGVCHLLRNRAVVKQALSL